MSATVLSLAKVRSGVLVTEDAISTSLQNEVVELAKKSREILGYSVLYNKVVVRKLLEDLSIDIYTKDSVWDYLGLVFARATKKKQDDDKKKVLARRIREDDEEEDDEEEDDEPSIRPKKFKSISKGRAIRNNTSRELMNMGWIRLPINCFDKDIPPHVLDRAVRVKEQIPEGELFVLSFEPDEAQVQIAVLDDPFLELQVGDESFYIDVWDEKDFEAKV